MKLITIKKIKLFFFLFFFTSLLIAQTSKEQIVESYKNFINSPREVAYVHLNKSTLIKNEMIGFTAYVLDKYTKKPSLVTKNLYCTLTDKNGKIVKSKLVEVNKGIASNVFKVDSLFQSGKYLFRAYTNWMFNFDEPNFHEHPITVIDPQEQKEVAEMKESNSFTVQVLPEGGHLIEGVKNQLGIIAKDTQGFGLSNASGVLLNNKNQPIKKFTLNQFGIAKVSLTPQPDQYYRVILSKGKEKVITSINDIDQVGFNLSLLNYPNKIALVFNTNKKSMPYVRSKNYILAIHNGSNVKTTNFQFGNKNQVIKALDHDNLQPGINIFTVFDPDNNTPILERMFFNWKGISKANITNTLAKNVGDSITVSFKVDKHVNLEKVQNLSVSVLPKNTKSYQFNSNILSQSYLNSYVKGFIENAGYYFSDNSSKTKSDLDNLLITQGWSSYDWSTIFQKPVINHRFENGVDVIANINNKKHKRFIAYPLKDQKPNIVLIGKNDSQYTHAGLFPYENDSYGVSTIRKSGRADKAGVFLQFFPAEIPHFNFSSLDMPTEDLSYLTSSLKINPLIAGWIANGGELLDEVVVKVETERAKKIEKLKRTTNGRVYVLDSRDRKHNFSLNQYLGFIGLSIGKSGEHNFPLNQYLGYSGISSISKSRGYRRDLGTVRAPTSLVIDGFETRNLNYLDFMRIEIVDYIEVKRDNLGMTNAFVIKIYTDPTLPYKDNKNISNFSNSNYKLTFSKQKKFYTPVYSSKKTKFFKNFGVINWLPNVTIGNDGFATFKIPKGYEEKINLYVEGIVNGKDLISQIKTIHL